MYCRKCGKEIEDNSKFCPYCGYNQAENQGKVSDTMEQSIQPQKEDETGKQNVQLQKKNEAANRKKWIIPMVIAVSAVIVGIAVFLGIKTVQKPEEIAKQGELIEGEKDAEKQEEQKVEYPIELTLDEEVKQGIINLLDLISHMEGREIEYKEIDNSFADFFLKTSLDREIPFVDGQVADWNAIPKDILDSYLKNSIGYQNYDVGNGGEIHDGVVTVYMAYGEMIPLNNTPQIGETMQISDEEIEIFGTVDYTESDYIGFLPYTAEFDVIMTKNPDSMWGGYTLKEIKSWE